MPMPLSTRDNISSFILERCMEFPTEKVEMLIKMGLLTTIYGYKSCRNVYEDSVFLKKLFASPPEQFRGQLWNNVCELQSSYNGDFVQNLFSLCGTELFTSSLKFSHDKIKQGFVTKGFPQLTSCLNNMLMSTENPWIIPDFQEL
ncbi:unnamed protein product [Allacma fusca]|uniref:Uncharacterized protein n=1 Tax=Allacma fusca TaxID=39272 RepID=A0A8J2LFF1_9HEXA|nr:unnamed protein product [Allacma fusca]